jgi:hypothetical protein
MEMQNHTPFMPLVFESQDAEDRRHHVIVLKGAYEIVNGQSLKLAPEPKPLTMADEYYGDPTKTSLKRESDLAPFKPRTDVHFVDPVAFAPGGKPAARWQVRVQVGPVQKALRVTGQRQWVRKFAAGWKLTAPEPVAEVQLRYENAFGGFWQHKEENGVWEENPLGKGFVNPKYLDASRPVPAPQIEAPDEPVTELGKAYKPQGLGPLARAWQPRRRKAGTFDYAWLKQRWPGLPQDFSDEHYNSSHPELVAPAHFRGDEAVSLQGLSPEGTLAFRLPGHRVLVALRFANGRGLPAAMFLDTVEIDAGRRQCSLVWRMRLPKEIPIRAAVASLMLPKE